MCQGLYRALQTRTQTAENENCGGWRGEKMCQGLYMALQTRTQLPKRKLRRKKKRMQNEMFHVFQSAPAVDRDSDSYKQPLLASFKVMIGLMRHLDEQNLISLEEGMRESKYKYIRQVTASFINSYCQPTVRDSGPRWSHQYRMYLVLEQSTTRESALRMLNHLEPLQIWEKMARVVAKMDLAVLEVEKGWGSLAKPVGRLRAWE